MQGDTPVPYIVYVALPENPQCLCKPPSGYILRLNIPTIFPGIPLGGYVNLPMLYMLDPPGSA